MSFDLKVKEKQIDEKLGPSGIYIILFKEKLIVFGNLPYNISTEILCKWILNLDSNYFWFNW